MWFKMKGVKAYTVNGKLYCYHRKSGLPLPTDPAGMAIRMAEIDAAEPSSAPKTTGMKGTWSDLIARYQASPEFNQLGELTKRDYRRHLTVIGEEWGALDTKSLRRKHARDRRDQMADTPRKANYRLQVLSLLMSYGIDLDEDLYGALNPVKGIKKLRQGPGYSPWPDNVLTHFMEQAYPELRWVVTAALETGQRGQDVIAMSWVHWNGTNVEVMQKKTRTRVWIPASAVMRQVLADAPKRQAVIFTTPTGKRWTGGWLSREIAKALLPHKGYGLHGLRYKAARRMHAAGCDWDQIAAITGHSTMKMARMYAERQERASEAIIKLERM